MASKDGGERRMLFDIRGRRKNVVKVVYAILALLMGLSLLLFFGPAPLTELFGTGTSTTTAADQLEDQAERLERKLKKDPQNPELLLALTRAQIGTGNALAISNPETGEVAFTPESRQQMFLASETWSKYLKATDEPNAGGAQLAAQAFFGLAQTARTISEAEGNVGEAAKAQQIVAEDRPSLGSLSTLAIYRYYSFDYKGAEQARREAAKYASGKSEREALDKQLDEISKRGHEFEKQVTQIEKEAEKAREEGIAPASNPLAESNPLGGG
jgi:hypothetical protein